MKWNYILSGAIGAIIVILAMLAISVWFEPFNHKYILNPDKVIEKMNCIQEHLTCTQISVLKDLENKGLLLTPQEYTSHISSYYSTLVAFLIGLFVLFTVGSIIGIRITSRKEIEEAKDDLREKLKTSLSNELKDSKSFYENIIGDILGRIEDDIVTKSDKYLVDKNLDEIARKQIEMEENINLLFNEVDAKSEIKEV
jgi:ABC-type multidrug transport system fused ATPase/permease subunit